jgi:hypothetical protein
MDRCGDGEQSHSAKLIIVRVHHEIEEEERQYNQQGEQKDMNSHINRADESSPSINKSGTTTRSQSLTVQLTKGIRAMPVIAATFIDYFFTEVPVEQLVQLNSQLCLPGCSLLLRYTWVCMMPNKDRAA